MNWVKATEAMSELKKVRYCLVATADKEGLPHMAAAKWSLPGAEGLVEISSWFCPGTMRNVQQNKHVALVIWDEKRDIGLQLLGRVHQTQESGILNGYAADLLEEKPIPQVRWRLLIKVSKVIEFKQAAHSDAEA